MKFRALVAFGAIAMSSVLTADAQQSQQLSIATGGTGGVYYPSAAVSAASSARPSPARRLRPR